MSAEPHSCGQGGCNGHAMCEDVLLSPSSASPALMLFVPPAGTSVAPELWRWVCNCPEPGIPLSLILPLGPAVVLCLPSLLLPAVYAPSVTAHSSPNHSGE